MTFIISQRHSLVDNQCDPLIGKWTPTNKATQSISSVSTAYPFYCVNLKSTHRKPLQFPSEARLVTPLRTYVARNVSFADHFSNVTGQWHSLSTNSRRFHQGERRSSSIVGVAFGGAHGTNRTPSRRTSRAVIPIHRIRPLSA